MSDLSLASLRQRTRIARRGLGMSKSIASTMVDATAAAAVSHRSRFFLVMSIVLFLPVAVGFWPTFFLRPWSGATDYLGGAGRFPCTSSSSEAC